MNKFNIIIVSVFLLGFGAVQANNISFIVNKGVLTYDTAKNISQAASVVTKADAVLKKVGYGLDIAGIDLIKLAAGASFIFIAPLNDGRYLIQALSNADMQNISQADLENIAYRGIKLALYFYHPLCYEAVGHLETGKQISEFYQAAIDLNRQWQARFLHMAQKGQCNLL